VNSTVNVEVAVSAWAAVGQNVFIVGGGHYEVTAVPDATHITVKNLDTNNQDPGDTIASPAKVSPSGRPATAGAGDMILNAEQTVTALKTFADGTLGVRNLGDTKTSLVKTAAAVDDRTFTLPDKDGTAALEVVASALTYASTTSIDFNGDHWKTLTLTGNVVFETVNKLAGRGVDVKITAAAERTLAFPAEWDWLGVAAPAAIPAGSTWLLKLRAYGATEADVVAVMLRDDADAVSSQVVTLTSADDGDDQAITFKPGGIHSLKVTVTDTYGGGAWAYTFTLATALATGGERVRALFILPASTDPTITIKTPNTGGSTVLAFTCRSFASQLEVDFVFRGGAWMAEAPRETLSDGTPATNGAVRGTTTYAATVNVDLDGPAYQQITATGALALGTLSGSRAGSGEAKTVSVLVTASGGDRAVTFAAGVKGVGDTLPSGKTAAVCLVSTGANEADTLAAYAQLD
jgi:hypothetical protein